jgi:hypothetical protein
MSKSLRILVTEAEPGAAFMATDELTAAGHTVVRCTEPGAPMFPCGALSADGDRCPLHKGPPVDVVLDVRNNPRPLPTPGEQGVTCALRRHIPLVVAGGTTLNPFEEWATEVRNWTFDVTDACERAAARPLYTHSERAAAAMHDTLDAADGPAVPARVVVNRENGRLVVRVMSANPLDPEIRRTASVRMIAALRSLDPYAAGIDVVFSTRHQPGTVP